jgi:hypothetical protein
MYPDRTMVPPNQALQPTYLPPRLRRYVRYAPELGLYGPLQMCKRFMALNHCKDSSVMTPLRCRN